MNIPSISFILQEKKAKNDGTAPIYLRITLNGTRAEITTKIYSLPANWDKKRGLIKGKDPLSIRHNQQLQRLHLQVFEALDQIKIQRFDINANNLKLAMQGKLVKAHTLLEVYKLFIEQLENRTGSDYSESSLETNKITYDQFVEFLTTEGKLSIKIEDFNNQQFIRLEHFFKKTKGNQHNTTCKKIERVKAMLRWAYEMDYCDKDVSKKFKIKKQKKEIIFLTQEEINRIKALKLVPRLEVIRDSFLFMCHTGLPFNEIERLKEENLSKNISGGYGIIMTRQKTSKNIPEIPLLPIAIELIAKYETHPKRIIEKKLFPIPSNQNFNGYLKEIATLAKIEKQITTHTARKTFASTIALRNGMSMEVLSRALGHSNIKITQESYAELQNDRIQEEFKKVSINLKQYAL
ncbi:site-specific recombinase XerD [Algoriphagus boseongensis]|uniref:Site-specific recombinase XerD n=1 Tax=Algoriphagus boseongensis TaxID=1442587 RepID=A0A4R6T3D5_9BACT|nr:site-specific integrase [Algoriphagus boseongensis]TDQ15213.1 site-specific recombinase XerD [Algoriphagus boseongensis]